MNNTAALADAYAALKYEEKAIAARLDAVKAEIVAYGAKEIVGDTCIVAVIDKKGAETLDKAAALALLKSLGATSEQIAALTKVGKPTQTLMIKAKLELAI